jgi:hypothetical protein
MTAKQRLAMAIFTATQWHSDHGSGVALLSLGSTFKIHSEEHRRIALADIDGNLAWCRTQPYDLESEFDPVVEINRLIHLRKLVVACAVGKAWLSDRENMALNEVLYCRGTLAWNATG